MSVAITIHVQATLSLYKSSIITLSNIDNAHDNTLSIVCLLVLLICPLYRVLMYRNPLIILITGNSPIKTSR